MQIEEDKMDKEIEDLRHILESQEFGGFYPFKCGICQTPHGWFFELGKVYRDSSCGCASIQPRESDFAEIVEFIDRKPRDK